MSGGTGDGTKVQSVCSSYLATEDGRDDYSGSALESLCFTCTVFSVDARATLGCLPDRFSVRGMSSLLMP